MNGLQIFRNNPNQYQKPAHQQTTGEIGAHPRSPYVGIGWSPGESGQVGWGLCSQYARLFIKTKAATIVNSFPVDFFRKSGSGIVVVQTGTDTAQPRQRHEKHSRNGNNLPIKNEPDLTCRFPATCGWPDLENAWRRNRLPDSPPAHWSRRGYG